MQITLCLNSENWKFQLAKAKCKALTTLISRADKAKPWAQNDTIYNRFFGLNDEQSISIAALHAAAWEVSGGSSIWMHADPVNIATDQSNAFLLDRISLTDNEITSLLLDINQFLYADDYVLFAPQPNQWLLNLPKEPEITTVPVTEMLGSNIAEKLPVGKAEIEWRRLFTELQMLLHNHPVNQERRMRKLATVDALWFWGEGIVPQLEQTDWTHVWSDNEHINGLCYLSDTPYEPLPTSFADIADQLYPDGSYLIVISDKLQLNDLEQHWAQLLMQALKDKKIDKLQLVINKQIYNIDAKKLKRWWRRSKSLGNLGVV
jgi:hypothetical protein